MSLTPFVGAGQSVGLLGGSFDPAHAGHVHITREALRRFRLDHVWWLVSPGNPLKSQAPAALEARVATARRLMVHPRVRVTMLETTLGTRYSIDTVRALRQARPDLRFVWLLGADSLADFHHWRAWEEIFETLPIGVLGRPGERVAARMSPAARRFRHARLSAAAAPLLASSAAPAWCFVNVPLMDISSTDLRGAQR